jgi:hypothetical protein
MATTTHAAAKRTAPDTDTIRDLAELKTRQHAAWSSGDYAIVGTTLQIVGEELCEALDIRPGRKWKCYLGRRASLVRCCVYGLRAEPS